MAITIYRSNTFVQNIENSSATRYEFSIKWNADRIIKHFGGWNYIQYVMFRLSYTYIYLYNLVKILAVNMYNCKNFNERLEANLSALKISSFCILYGRKMGKITILMPK